MGKILDSDPSRTVLLVLGAAVWSDGPSPALRRRCRAASDAYHAGVASHVIASGGLGRHPPTEAKAIRDLLCDDGVPAAAIDIEDRSTTTLENIVFSLPILHRVGARRVILVTDLTHGPRALMTARAFGLSASLRSPPLKGARKRTLAYQVGRELLALPAYALRLRRLGRD
ncbi:YdcF family protein [Salipiger sp. IMCC34102]|uniref:YdcF family protein n=1 Tax=Salipiger sp. IMCC34102 TaxID=2510647 RepID=UPI001F5E1310|nr:YdcF family protein [Salipiger sp. IMCC34102]